MIEDMKLTEEEATRLIMMARVQAGWIDASALEVEEEEQEDAQDAAPAEPTAETLFS